MKALLAIILTGCVAAGAASAVTLTSATVTETKNVVIYKPASGPERPAKVKDVLQGADALRTGERSLAELEFNDKTITRLGSMSVFTFDAATREFRPEKGTTLISIPKGMGGGRVVTSAVTCGIEGTTLIVRVADVPGVAGGPPRRVCKMFFLEGHGTLTLTHPHPEVPCPFQKEAIKAGQMIAQFDDEPCLNPVRDFDLGALVNNSGIINDFAQRLPAMDAIQNEIAFQLKFLWRGTLVPDHVVAGLPSPNPQTGGQGLQDPPFTSPGIQPTCVDLPNGFSLCSRPMAGENCAPIAGGGGYVCHK